MEWMWLTFFPMRFVLFISLRLAKPYCYHTISMLTKHCNVYMRYSKLDYLTFYYVLQDNTEPRRCSIIRELNQKVMRVLRVFWQRATGVANISTLRLRIAGKFVFYYININSMVRCMLTFHNCILPELAGISICRID